MNCCPPVRKLSHYSLKCLTWCKSYLVYKVASQSSERTYFLFSSPFLGDILWTHSCKMPFFFFFLITLYSFSWFHVKEAGTILRYVPLITSNTCIHICRIFFVVWNPLQLLLYMCKFSVFSPVLDIFWLLFTSREFCS